MLGIRQMLTHTLVLLQVTDSTYSDMCPWQRLKCLLWLQDGRQKGEVQLAFVFQPFDPHSPQGLQCGPISSVCGNTVIADAEVSPQKAGHQARGTSDSALEAQSVGDCLGPLGQSFMNLSMTHISPTKPDSASKSLDSHDYLKVGMAPQGASGSSGVLPSAQEPMRSPAPVEGPPSTVQVGAVPQQRNFYPEEVSDEEAEIQSQHCRRASASGDSGAALPVEFRYQQPPHQADPRSAAFCSVNTASYSPSEVYHAYKTRGSEDAQPVLHLLPQNGAHTLAHEQVLEQGSELQPQVPAWRLLGTSPLHEGKQQTLLGQQPTGQERGHKQQPQVPQWRLLGTSPLHEGQMPYMAQPQAQQHAYADERYQTQGQGYSQHPHRQGHQRQLQPPDQHHMGARIDYGNACSTSWSFSGQGCGERSLSYASLAVGSWSDNANPRPLLSKPAHSQVLISHACECSCCM